MTIQHITPPTEADASAASLRALPDPGMPADTPADMPLEGIVETGWEVDGVDVTVVRLQGTVRESGDAVRVLREALECSQLEAEYAYRVICEDGEFVTSVQGDIDDLPLSAA